MLIRTCRVLAGWTQFDSEMRMRLSNVPPDVADAIEGICDSGHRGSDDHAVQRDEEEREVDANDDEDEGRFARIEREIGS